MTKEEALKKGIEALENIGRWLPTIGQKGLRDYEADAITAMKEALAQPAQEPRLDQGPEYERGFVDGRLYQTKTSVDKAVNALAQPVQEPEPDELTLAIVYMSGLLDGKKKRPWVGLMRGVRVEGDTVIISVKGGNDAARELCGALIKEMEA